MLKRKLSVVALCTALVGIGSQAAETGDAVASPVTVFFAKKIITMEPALPEATAVAVADGRIVAVGEPKDMDEWIARRGGHVDRTFRDKVLMPGFIDPHVHPSLPAVLTLSLIHISEPTRPRRQSRIPSSA